MAKNWRRGKSKNIAVTKNNTTSARLWADYEQLGSWDEVARKYEVTKAMAFRVAHGYEPHKSTIRLKLSLPIMAPGRVCPIHGVVHDKQCREHKAGPSKPKRNWKQAALMFAGLLLQSKVKD